MKFTSPPTNVIQYNEYYPFGLQTSTSWTRENTKDNNYLYNAANELNKTSGWYEMFYRGYDPAIGRMLQVDPYAPMYASTTTYNYALNNPVMMNDPSGGQTSVTGLSDYQVRALYRVARGNGESFNFDDWTRDNIDPMEAGTRNIVGTFGDSYAFDVSGSLVRGGMWVEYTIGESDGKGGMREVYGSTIVFEESGGTRFEPGTSDVDFRRNMILDVNGNLIRWEENGSGLVFVQDGVALKLLQTRLVNQKVLTPAAFSNALMTIVNGMSLPDGTKFDKNKVYNKEISLALSSGVVYNEGVLHDAEAWFNRMGDGSYKITFRHIAGESLTIQSVRSTLGIHEYYAHGDKGYVHPVHNEQINRLIKNYLNGQ